MKISRIAYFAVALFACMLIASPAVGDDSDEGFVSIFDGKTLEGWDGNPALWSVEDGAITGTTTEENPIDQNYFIIWRGGEVDDFVLRLDFKLVGGNSGIQYRSFEVPEAGKHVMGGYQADFESGERYSGIVYGEKFRGILCLRGDKSVVKDDHKRHVVETFADSAELQKHIKMEDWNTYEIIAKDYTFIHKINGVKMAELTDEDVEQRRASGLLGFQVHRGPAMKVQFKNIRLKDLSKDEEDGKKK